VARLRRDAAPSLPSRPVKIIVGLPPEAGRTSLLACWAGLGAVSEVVADWAAKSIRLNHHRYAAIILSFLVGFADMIS
jgi:hypothetical protein